MKKSIINIVLCLITCLIFSGCIQDDQYDNTPSGNFEQLWKLLDEKYCFFDYKHIDWDSVHTVFKGYITSDMSQDALFEVLGKMLGTLKDGHVNLYSDGNISRYWSWYEDYPRNYDEAIIEKYLGTEYRIAGGMKCCIFDDNIGYISYNDFTNAVGHSNINQVLQYMSICNGLIIDIRNNGGGNLDNSTILASHFTNNKVLTGYIRHKVGAGHNEFSEPLAIYLEPAVGIRWQKKVVVLTNRHCFSAANNFANAMHCLSNVTLLGDKTGGGGGFPFSSELPNGWIVRFSACPYYDAEMNQIEFGINPDINVSFTTEDYAKGTDTLIEAARKLLSK